MFGEVRVTNSYMLCGVSLPPIGCDMYLKIIEFMILNTLHIAVSYSDITLVMCMLLEGGTIFLSSRGTVVVASWRTEDLWPNIR